MIFFFRENEAPNQAIFTTLMKEIMEVDQIKNDPLCTERRVVGKLWLCPVENILKLLLF